MTPIFFAWTRSFWLGWFPALLTAVDVLFQIFADPAAGVPVASLIAALLAPVWPVSAADIEQTMRALGPLYALIVAHQRRGEARPYTMDWRARE